MAANTFSIVAYCAVEEAWGVAALGYLRERFG